MAGRKFKEETKHLLIHLRIMDSVHDGSRMVSTVERKTPRLQYGTQGLRPAARNMRKSCTAR